MKQFSIIALTICTGLFFTIATIPDAEAKRLGGGKSFGSKMSQNKPAKRTSSKPNKAQQQNSDRKQALSKKGGMMGLLGGLMIGGLLGAMFFGGAFENIDFMDILLIGGLAFLLFKLFTRRKQQQQPVTANGAPLEASNDTDQHQFRENPNENTGGGENKLEDKEPENILEPGKIPRNFDQKSFLTGAENVYALLQKAWDDGELGDLRQFCSDDVFAEIQDQIRARTDDNKTEILVLKSELINVVISGNSTEATVLFNAELKENDNKDDLASLTGSQEAWYFVRPDNRNENNWLLDGIQQIED